MTARYLLDTNALSDLIRNPDGLVASRIAKFGQDQVCTSIIVAGELRYGAAKSGSARLRTRVTALLDTVQVAALERPADIAYGELRAQLRRAGTPIGPNDLLIAAHALALGLILITDNEREFSRVPLLQIENWLR